VIIEIPLAICMPGSHAFASESTDDLRYDSLMNSILNILKERALYVSFADDAFHFDISWLGIVLVAIVLVIWRRIKR
jgi:hypothetical protein